MTTPPASPIPLPSGLPDRRKSRAVVGTFLVVMIGLMAFRAYAPHLRARPTDFAAPRLVDLNTADRTELIQVAGIGPERADAILAHRATYGPFQRVDELDAVRGIGIKTLTKSRPHLMASGGSAPLERLERKPSPTAYTSSAKIKPGEPPINVNTASVPELLRLPGVGPVMAQRIVECREEQPFETVEELRRVPRLGAKTLDGLRKFVIVR